MGPAFGLPICTTSPSQITSRTALRTVFPVDGIVAAVSQVTQKSPLHCLEQAFMCGTQNLAAARKIEANGKHRLKVSAVLMAFELPALPANKCWRVDSLLNAGRTRAIPPLATAHKPAFAPLARPRQVNGDEPRRAALLPAPCRRDRSPNSSSWGTMTTDRQPLAAFNPAPPRGMFG
jgi:hypothetical protein